MASLYLASDLTDRDVVAGSVVQVTGDEARHAITVARVRVGEKLSVSDGDGLLAFGTVTSTEGGIVSVEVESAARHPAPLPELWLAQALAKGDRDELAVQAATELGVAGVIPWAAERSISRWEGVKAAKGRDRWASIVREATKQSIRPRVPVVEPIASTGALTKLPGRILVLEPDATTRLTEVELDGDRITLVVGPEGGIAPRELDAFAAAGATLVRLGPEVLRTSTAGPAALAVLNTRLGRW
ncbi:16S rRNA (uracil(1498)-N(3))-methyltransferase [Pseudolysinimonas yzui]|uniref:Ribosomal RNA small subunit methyltransferase E n=1 Tax=Pseudolysinimonas yzui TaxID=2708254 RepID=A0A8J3GSS4_9MICO|nr:16S rRNA (uracil(1498)-N(3))-methyltransferase [Pseudolysinimonas yzui]GHF27311.1 ribosomal RNA small subunit methyltransferase E [Pseudolysinimonas yzui]